VGCSADGGEFVQVATLWKTATSNSAVQSPGTVTSGYAGCGGDPGGTYEVASDGGIFAYGGARFYGSAVGATLSAVVGIAAAGSAGYLVAEKDEQVLAYGDARNPVDTGGSSFDFVGIVTFGDPGGFFPAQANGTALSYGDYWYLSMNYNMTMSTTLNAQIVGIG
jgi:hypothetical protein